MSRNQRPRWPEFFPAMKRRGKGRRRRPRLTVWDGHGNPVWPPALDIDGHVVTVDFGNLRINGRMMTAESAPYWIEADDA